MLNLHRCIAANAEFLNKLSVCTNPLDDPQQASLRVKRLNEELDELSLAIDSQKMRDAADAVIDTIYVASGNIFLLGDKDGSIADHIYLSKEVLIGVIATLQRRYRALPLQHLWDEVHATNMRKERGTEKTSKYGTAYDVVKPAGWVPPFLDDILAAAGVDPNQSAYDWHKANGLLDD